MSRASGMNFQPQEELANKIKQHIESGNVKQVKLSSCKEPSIIKKMCSCVSKFIVRQKFKNKNN